MLRPNEKRKLLMDPKKKFFLFKQSNHFCSVPWNQFEVFSNGNVKTCSIGGVLGNLHKNTLEEILQGQVIKDLKNGLVNDLAMPECAACHRLSTPGEHFDLRNHYNPMFLKFNINYEDINEFNLHAIDLHWDNTCNFKCIYCNAFQSSSIAQEQNVRFNKLAASEIDKIIELIVANQDNMQEIYLSGGEPLLIKHNTRLLSSLTNTNIFIRINSNISHALDSNPVFNELKRFKNVLWTVSAESQNSKFEYTRFGSKWHTFLENLERIKSIGHQIRLNSVFFICNMIDIFDNIEYFVKQHNVIDVTINQLYQHEPMRPCNAPPELKRKSKDRINQLLESGLIPYKSNTYYNIARCHNEIDLPVENSSGFKEYLDTLDTLRGTNWRGVFGELI